MLTVRIPDELRDDIDKLRGDVPRERWIRRELERVCEAEQYALTKVATGDYLLPSNDAQTVWRIARYTDGPSGGLEIPHDREFWGVWRWTGKAYAIDTRSSAWDRWDVHDAGFNTRADAIRAALRA